MTALGGKLPKRKGHDDLTVRVKDFVAGYDKYVRSYNKQVDHIEAEKELLSGRDMDGLVEHRQNVADHVTEVIRLRQGVRDSWAQLKTTWRRFNRGKML